MAHCGGAPWSANAFGANAHRSEAAQDPSAGRVACAGAQERAALAVLQQKIGDRSAPALKETARSKSHGSLCACAAALALCGARARQVAFISSVDNIVLQNKEHGPSLHFKTSTDGTFESMTLKHMKKT
uniref:Uncharacterized protein n=1 Tax=Rhipicephalus zambeziensis TaxID=60191 RepID=A0A224YHM1_9ACAR